MVVQDFMEGRLLKEVKLDSELLVRLGELVGRMVKGLEKVDASKCCEDRILWSMDTVLDLEQYISAVDDDSNRKNVQQVISNFRRVLDTSRRHNLPQSFVHTDVNDNNILISHTQPPTITALLDFGEAYYDYQFFDISIAIAYAMLSDLADDVSLFDVGGYLLRGYCSAETGAPPLAEIEFQMIKLVAEARLALSLVLGAWTFKNVQPDNEYVLDTARKGWRVLDEMRKRDDVEVLGRWRSFIQ